MPTSPTDPPSDDVRPRGPVPVPGGSGTVAESARSTAARRRAIVGLLVALVAAGGLTWLVASGSGAPLPLDRTLTDTTRAWADPAVWPVDLAHAIGLVTAPLWSALAAAVLVIALLLTGYRAAGGLIAMSGIAGLATSETVKAAMGRQRPPGAELYEPDLDKSFPSGHAMEGIYLYLATGLVLIHLGRATGRRWMQQVGVALVVVGPLIGLSRLVLGVHWPSDILAGWAFGSAALLASALILWGPLDRGWGGGRRGVIDPGPPAADATPGPPAG